MPDTIDHADASPAPKAKSPGPPRHSQQAGQVEGVHSAPLSAWVAVGAMIVGFALCTFGFILGNNLILWISGGVIGAIGVAVAFTTNIMSNVET